MIAHVDRTPRFLPKNGNRYHSRRAGRARRRKYPIRFASEVELKEVTAVFVRTSDHIKAGKGKQEKGTEAGKGDRNEYRCNHFFSSYPD